MTREEYLATPHCQRRAVWGDQPQFSQRPFYSAYGGELRISRDHTLGYAPGARAQVDRAIAARDAKPEEGWTK
jgi:hypothetical protein